MKYFLISLLICTTGLSSMAQDKIVLQHQRRSKKQVELSPDYTLRYRLTDKTRHFGKIQSFDASQITIMKYDSSMVSMTIDEIELISDFGYRNTRWLEPFTYVAFGAAMTVGAIPLLWVTGGGDKALEGLEFAGILTAVSAPPLIIGSRAKRYNLKKRWKIEAR